MPSSAADAHLPHPLEVGGRSYLVDRATMDDVAAVVSLLRDDPLGSAREVTTDDDTLRPYLEAFEDVDADPRQLLLVAHRPDGTVVATVALTTDRRRTDAHRFYERLGWVDSHKGMKLALSGPPRRPPEVS